MGGNARAKIGLIFGLIIVSLAVVFAGRFFLEYFDKTKEVYLSSGTELKLEVADTPSLRSTGLSGRDTIGEYDGMLFIFESASSRHCFWMADTNIDLDIIFLSEEKEVINISYNAQPQSYSRGVSFCPDGDALYTIELAAGQAKELRIDPGQKLSWED